MLHTTNRLRKDADYRRLVKNSRAYCLESLSVRATYNNKNITRVGVVVGKTVSKKAVERNRLRRQLQEIVRLFLKEKRLVVGLDIMVRPNARALTFAYAELRALFTTVCARLRLLA